MDRFLVDEDASIDAGKGGEYSEQGIEAYAVHWLLTSFLLTFCQETTGWADSQPIFSPNLLIRPIADLNFLTLAIRRNLL